MANTTLSIGADADPQRGRVMSVPSPLPGPCHALGCPERETCQRWVDRFLIPEPPLGRGEPISLWFEDEWGRCLNRIPVARGA